MVEFCVESVVASDIVEVATGSETSSIGAEVEFVGFARGRKDKTSTRIFARSVTEACFA